MMDLLWNPILSVQATVFVFLLGLLVMLWSTWRGLASRVRGAISWVIRALALALLVLVLFQPQRRVEEVTVLKPQLAVLIDGSESMADAADPNQPRRSARVAEWLASPVLAKAREAFDVRFFRFDSAVTELPENAGDPGYKGGVSNVVAAVNQVQERFRGQPLAAIAALTDAIDTSGAARNASLQPGAPVFTFELEKPFKLPEKPRRIALSGTDFPTRVVVGWDAEIRATYACSGLAGKTVAVELWRDGRKDRDATLAFSEDEQSRAVAFPLVVDKPGMIQFELRVISPDAEADAKSHPFVVEAIPPGKRILYLQSSLGFDFKFLRKAIISDRNLELSAFVRWADGRIVSMGERGMPAETKLDLTTAGLSKYAVVLLGDLKPEVLTADQYVSLKEFVNRGGGLVVLGGSNGLSSPDLAKTAFGELSPIRLPAEYREASTPVNITEAGLRHPVFGPLFAEVKDFPPLLTVNAASGVAPTAEVLIEANSRGQKVPLVSSMRFGQGRVVVIATDTVWRWRLAAKTWNQAKSPYDTFWTQLMDWLIPKEQENKNSDRVDLFTERANYLLGEKPEMRAIVRLVDSKAKPPAMLALTVTTPDDKTFNYTMKAKTLNMPDGRQVAGYSVEVEPNVPGVFAGKATMKAGADTIEGEARFVVAKPPTELTGKPINRELLKRIADANGGRYLAMEDRDLWLDGVRVKEQTFSRVKTVELWNHPILFVLLLTLIAGDWVARKTWNLP